MHGMTTVCCWDIERIELSMVEIKVKERLAQLKAERNLSSRQIGEMTGITKRSINGYLVGTIKPSIENLVKLADLFDCSLDYLVGRDSRPKEKTE